MKNIVKLFCLVFIFSILPAFSLEYGGTFDTSAKFTIPKDSFVWYDVNTLSGFVKHNLNEVGSSYIAAEALAALKFSGTYDSSASASESNTYFWLDLSLLKYVNVFSLPFGNLKLSVGRFGVSDLTSIILDQASDGAYISLDMDRVVANAYASYTGLLNRQFVSILNDTSSTYTYEAKSVYAFASPYIIALLNVQAPYLFLNQTVSAEGIGAFGAAGPNGDNSGYNRFYGSVGIDGPVLKDFSYKVTGTLGTYSEAEGVFLLTQGEFTYYPPVLSSSVTAKVLYASGQKDSVADFRAITSKSANISYQEPEYSDLFTFGLLGTIKPLANLLVKAGCDLYFNCAEEFAYNGLQLTAGAQYQPFTDLLLSLSLGSYFAKEEDNGAIQIALNALISF